MTQESNTASHSDINGHYRGIMVATTLTDTNNVSFYAWGHSKSTSLHSSELNNKQLNINIREKSPNMLQEMLSYFTTILIVYYGNNSLENMLTDNL